jgi:Flp pilus assembly protein TadD
MQHETEITEIVQRCRDGLDSVQAQARAMLPALTAGASLARVRGMTPEHLEALYSVAARLCDWGQFGEALPVALQLVLHAPRESRYLFVAGTCLQRLGQPGQAAPLFAAALLLEQTAPGHLRLGQCLRAMGDDVKAREVFEAAIEFARRDETLRRVLDDSEAELRTLHAHART